MSTAVVLPQMGLEVTEGLVTALTVAVGDSVAEGDVIAEVETDKAIAEVPATLAGTVIGIDVEVGDTIEVGATILRLGEPGEDGELVAAAVGSPAEAAAPTAAAAAASSTSAPAPPATGATTSTNGSDSGRRRAAPIARRAAERLGIPLERVSGTGPGGRITLGDVEREAEAAPAASASPTSTPAEGERFEELTTIRAAIARRMAESQLVPQYNLQRQIDVTWLLAEKARLSAAGPAKVGVVDLLLQALAETLVRQPLLAASFVPAADGNAAGLRHPAGVDVGVAVATDRGLLVPALRQVQKLGLAALALERARLVELTRAGRLPIGDMGGAATTLSSLGTFGVDSFTAMINPGESSILAVGRTVERAIPRDRGIAVVPTLSLTMTFDHRVVDGATGAAALVELADLLEGGMEWRP
ncbi:MAG TPA: dihydrolipoamide acetyltransferase family protein [Solirubrobacterales bacterium]|nr:dihydrolipoamide acetyltransferase family protein [Solirubrobacterales bacterium]